MDDALNEQIAIIGLACRFPGANSPAALWEVFRRGGTGIRRLEQDDASSRLEPGYVPYSGDIADKDRFDAEFFGFNRRSAELMDPQMRFFLECAWQGLEDAGYDSQQFDGRIGVFAGTGVSTYFLNHVSAHPQLIQLAGGLLTSQLNSNGHVSTMTSYKLDLRGPSVNVQTACSTGLTAVHLACQSLLNRECDLALAGASYVACPGSVGYFPEPGGILSPDGHCRPFDESGNGTLFSDGVGIVVLRRLGDALEARDNILAVVRGSAMNNDGSQKVSYNAPSVDGQVEVVAEALAVADVDPRDISYLEAHGTGTALGDPVELTALMTAFGGQAEGGPHCAIGSAKGNFGHTNSTAGVLGLMKTVLALKEEHIPPTINVTRPTSKFDFDSSPFFLATAPLAWPRSEKPRLAGVSSLGMGGTNVHVILDEAPTRLPTSHPRRKSNLLTISAKTPAALRRLTASWAERLHAAREDEVADLCFTSRVGRRSMAHRIAVVGESAEELGNALSTQPMIGAAPRGGARRPVFMFPGQGAQVAGLGGQLYKAEVAFRESFDKCARIYEEVRGGSLARLAFSSEAEQLVRTDNMQPAVFAMSYALAQLWRSWGVEPQYCVGHSLGEYVAACIAGVFTAEAAMRIVTERGRLMASVPAGAMYSLRMDERDVQPLLDAQVSIAAVNAAGQCVVSGPMEALEAWLAKPELASVEARRLNVSHAFHSVMMDPVLEEFEAFVRKHGNMQPSKIPMVSNVTGEWLSPQEATNPAYYTRHLRSPVRFARCLETIAGEADTVLVEVGPGDVLSSLARRQPGKGETPIICSLPLGKKEGKPAAGAEERAMVRALGRLWTTGYTPDWRGFDGSEQRARLAAPTYSFEKARHWLTPAVSGAGAGAATARQDGEPSSGDDDETRGWEGGEDVDPPATPTEEVVARIWQDVLSTGRLGRTADFIELGADSLIVVGMMRRVREELCPNLPVGAVYEGSTVAAFAAQIDALNSAEPEVEPPADEDETAEELMVEDDVLSQLGLAEDE